MRLGGEIKRKYNSPEEWVAGAKAMGYSAVYAPFNYTADSAARRAYREAAEANDLVIGEVGVWRNCLALDDAERKTALEYAKEQLALADELGARCCVNIIGNRGEIWDGFDPTNFDPDVYVLAVDSVREIIDAVKPTHTFYSIESMPWMIPDSPENYLQLLADVDREAFGVHLDYVNMINNPRRYLKSTEFIAHCFELLGPRIKSIHGKDSLMEKEYTTVIRETMPGKGTLDYVKILPMVEKLGGDTVFFLEHMPDEESYRQAADYIRMRAEQAGVHVK